MSPPIMAAVSHNGIAAGRDCMLAKLPARPAAELTRMKAAETPPVLRVSAHPVKIRSGLKKIPPSTGELREETDAGTKRDCKDERNRFVINSIDARFRNARTPADSSNIIPTMALYQCPGRLTDDDERQRNGAEHERPQ